MSAPAADGSTESVLHRGWLRSARSLATGSDPALAIHRALAALFVALIPIAPAPRDIAFVALAVCAAVRLPQTLPSYRALLRMPVIWLLLAWPAWQAISILWSLDAHEGWRGLRAMRAVLIPFLLWPVGGRGRYLIGAFLTGVVLLNALQALSAAGLVVNQHSVLHASRFGGLLNPIQAGISCALGLCWAAAAVLASRGRTRLLVSMVMLAAAAGLFVSGSRGPWIGALAGFSVLLIVMAARHPSLRRRIATLAALAVVAGVVALATPRFQERYAQSVSETSTSLEKVDATTSIGLRVWLWRAAWEEFRTRPLLGVGAGGFHAAALKTEIYASEILPLPAEERLIPTHSHSIYLHVLAEQGIVGGVILAGFLVLAFRQARRDREDAVYGVGTLAALTAWTIGAAFDCYNLSGQTTYELALLLALTLPGRTNAGRAATTDRIEPVSTDAP